VSRLLPVALALLLAVSACRSTRPSGDAGQARLERRVDSLEQAARQRARTADSLRRAARLRNPNLHSTLWQQTAVEYRGLARGAYALARRQMERALADSAWTAALEQAERGPESYRGKPPAVVLDVDETVLDNSPYQARLVLDDETYGSDSWQAWCREEAAGAVPGARAFTRAADSMGVQVIYLTNRDAEVEAATRDNLEALGFPVDDAPDAVLTQGERDGWEPKSTRRAWVADRYRILLLVGDNFGDFAAEAETSVARRARRAERYRRYWGTRWIVLPNAQYGSWEGALYDFNYGLGPIERLEAKHDHLEPKR
jgi:acid phosphatase